MFSLLKYFCIIDTEEKQNQPDQLLTPPINVTKEYVQQGIKEKKMKKI